MKISKCCCYVAPVNGKNLPTAHTHHVLQSHSKENQCDHKNRDIAIAALFSVH